MKRKWMIVGIVAALVLPLAANAQGIIGGTQQGAHQGAQEGSKAAGPVGGAVGGVVGGTVGGVTGGVKGVLGVSEKPKKKSKTKTDD